MVRSAERYADDNQWSGSADPVSDGRASARDYNADLVWTADGTTNPNADRGTWQADGMILTIQWENGNTSRFAYGFEPNGALVFRNAHTITLINFYDRVR